MAKTDFKIAQAIQVVNEAMAAGLAAGASAAQNEIKKLVGRPGTGRTYRRKTKKATYHTASAPGRPPALNIGAYRNTIQTDLTALKSKPPRAFVGTNSKLGPWLEFGTRHMAPRPHWRLLFSGKRKKRIEAAVSKAALKKFKTASQKLT